MAISPLSRSLVSSPSFSRPSSVEPVSPRTQGPADVQGAKQGQLLRRMFEADGFDAPVASKSAGGLKAGGLEEMARELSQLVQMMNKVSRMLGGEGSAAPAPSAQVAKAEGAAPAGGASKSGNTMTFTNDGKSPMTIQFTPNAGDKAIDPVTLAPGSTQTVSFPQGWSGNFRSTSGDGAAATLGEVKFNGAGDQTFYDVSYIEGDNAAMTIEPEGGGKKSGSTENFLESAPDSIKAKNADGSAYGIKKTTTSNVQDPSVVDFYRKRVGADQGYVIPTDDASTLATRATRLAVHLRNLA